MRYLLCNLQLLLSIAKVSTTFNTHTIPEVSFCTKNGRNITPTSEHSFDSDAKIVVFSRYFQLFKPKNAYIWYGFRCEQELSKALFWRSFDVVTVFKRKSNSSYCVCVNKSLQCISTVGCIQLHQTKYYDSMCNVVGVSACVLELYCSDRNINYSMMKTF